MSPASASGFPSVRSVLHGDQDDHPVSDWARDVGDEFITQALHDLRSPLGLIRGWAEILKLARQSPEVLDEAQAALVHGSLEQQDVLDALQEFCRLRAGFDLNSDVISDLSRVIDSECRAAMSESRARSVHLHWAGTSGPVLIRGEAGRLGRLVRRLETYALRHAPAGGVIRICLQEQERTLTFRVTDPGPPFLNESTPFERSQRSDSGGNPVDRLEFGLADARLIVESLGGLISAANAPGGGAMIEVSFPKPS